MLAVSIRMARVPRLALAASTLVLACNALLGIDDPILDGQPAAGDAGDAGTFPDCGAPPSPDDGPIYVLASGGVDDAACGAHGSPCATIAFAIVQAQHASKTNVRVGPGTYRESIALAPGITIEGGYFAEKQGDEYAWIPDCLAQPKPSDDVHIAPDVAIPVTAVDLGGTATLSTLTIDPSAKPTAGESLYGIVAIGATTHLELIDVIVAPADAADGATGTAGEDGSAPSGPCPVGDGGDGVLPGSPGGGADAGSVDPSGYRGPQGASGSTGEQGSNGEAGGDGACITCPPCNATCSGTSSKQCGDAGVSGCGGAGGDGGGGGGAGGSSIALFVWGATVHATGGSLRSGAGGQGGAGGGGGQGAPGTVGSEGRTTDGCNTTCVAVVGCSGFMKAAGGAGTRGGAGAAGGQGGGGAGGWSYAVVTGGGAIADVPDETLDHSNFGRGGAPGGANGRAGKRYPDP